MRIGLLSDSHSYIDDHIISYLEGYDEIWHAGDIGQLEVTDKLALVAPVRAVYGNIDGHEIRQVHPEHQVFSLGGVKVWMTHIGGYPGRYPSRIKEGIRLHQPDLFICGHSHILKVMPDKVNRLLHINPGAVGKHGFHKIRTLIRFSILEQKIENLEVIELGARGKL